jgi:hypothetical protein
MPLTGFRGFNSQYNPTLRDVFFQVPCNFTQHRQWRKQRRMNIINDYFINKLSKSCFNFTISLARHLARQQWDFSSSCS